ncbi:MAG: alpha/beta hydrolase [Candidatus Marinimicrobia bacterium]|jgi:hypothetical protein|nr:alpha/beta hydrolase [Candidatus Neomarinimicrobiota bacterium]
MIKKISKMRLWLILVCLLVNLVCSKRSKRGIPYSLLITGDQVKKSGEMIQGLPLGLNEIYFDSSKSDTVFVSVHGYDSRGYEWVYPLKSMAESGNRTFYYRWDWNQCPQRATDDLHDTLVALLNETVSIKHLIIFGHSYGGVITANLMETQLGSVEIHSIAAPLSGHPKFKRKCSVFPDFSDMVSRNSLIQWRTQHKQDGAFKNLEINPQVVSVSGSKVVQLPDRIDGRRLGHNWSITWVIDMYLNKNN